MRAFDFVNSIGVNAKGSMLAEGYANSSLIIQSLNYLGVDKIRDALVEYSRAAPVLDALAEAGIKFNVRVSSSLPATGETGMATYIGALKSFQAEHPDAILSVEGLNEVNAFYFSYNGNSSIVGAANFQSYLYTSLKSAPELSHLPVYNFTIAYNAEELYAQIGDLGSFSDAANIHFYISTGGSADRRMENVMGLARAASGGDPLVITEIGHTTLESEPAIGTSQTAQAKMMLSELLLAYENGAAVTYIYELFDNNVGVARGEKERHFGLFHENGDPKLAATALRNLTTVLGAGDDGTADGVLPAPFSVQSSATTVHAMGFDKSGDVYNIAVWNDRPVWNDTLDVDYVNPVVLTVVDFGRVEAIVRLYDPMLGLAPIATYTNVSSITVPLRDSALIIEVGAAGPVQERSFVSAPHLTLTAAELVAQIDTLVLASGLQSVTLTDSNVLAVSTTETMAHMMAHYGATLNKIVGGYSFSVTYGEPTWTKVQSFDAGGVLMLTKDYILQNGVAMSEVDYHPDGSRDNYRYNITGQTYVTEHQAFDPSGALVLFQRYLTSGGFHMRDIRHPDGGRTYETYNALGQLTNSAFTAADGATTTRSYAAATGHLVSEVIREADGDVLTTLYTNGQPTRLDIVSHEGGRETLTYHAITGLLLTDYRLEPDGNSATRVYTDGTLQRITLLAADGGKDILTLKITGKAYVAEHQVLDPTGGTLLFERFLADGGFHMRDIRHPNGSRTYETYNALGLLTNSTFTAADGATTTRSYVAATGHLVSEVIREADGDVLTTGYTNGARTRLDIVSHEGWRETTTYHATTGALLTDYRLEADGSSATSVFTDGTLQQRTLLAANGGKDIMTHKILGQTYVAEHQVLHPTGALVLLERFLADGGYNMRDIRHPDGDRTYETYNALGRKIGSVLTETDGSIATRSFDAASGRIVSEVLREADGDVVTTLYANGSRTSLDVVSHEGWRETLTYHATTGVLLTDYRLEADGDSVTHVYTGGTLQRLTLLAADGERDVTTYKIADKPYVTERQVLDPAGGLLLFERLLANGGYNLRDIRHPDGTRTYETYDALGRLTNSNLTAADGAREIIRHHIQNQAYVSERKILDPAGTQTLLERFLANGGLQLRERLDPDGDRLSESFDSLGRKIGSVLTETDGSIATRSFDAASGRIVSEVLREADGDVVTTLYANGSRTSLDVVSHEGWRETLTYHATTGVLLTDYRLEADGDSVTHVYTGGTLQRLTLLAADGERDVTTYKIADKPYVTERQVLDPAGGLLLFERLLANGGYNLRDIRHPDGTRTYETYDALGRLTNSNHTHADGTRSSTTYFQDSTGDVRTDAYDISGALLTRSLAHADGTYDLYAYADNQTLVGGASNDAFYFRTTASGRAIYEGGADTVYNFNIDANGIERIVLDNQWAESFGDLSFSQQGAHVLVSFGDDDYIVIKQQSVRDIQSEYFMFI